MEQLGPFHFFFTLSAAEMKWSDVSTAILHTKGEVEKIVYLKDWEYDDNLIIVVNTDGTETPLPEYMKNVAKHNPILEPLVTTILRA